MNGHFDNPGLCFQSTFTGAKYHPTGKEPRTPKGEVCVCVCVCVSQVAERPVTCLKLPNKLVTGKVDCPQPHAHREGKNEEASHPLPICL